LVGARSDVESLQEQLKATSSLSQERESQHEANNESLETQISEITLSYNVQLKDHRAALLAGQAEMSKLRDDISQSEQSGRELQHICDLNLASWKEAQERNHILEERLLLSENHLKTRLQQQATEHRDVVQAIETAHVSNARLSDQTIAALRSVQESEKARNTILEEETQTLKAQILFQDQARSSLGASNSTLSADLKEAWRKVSVLESDKKDLESALTLAAGEGNLRKRRIDELELLRRSQRDK